MILTTRIEGNFQDLLARAKTGDQIQLCTYNCNCMGEIKNWWSELHGVIIQRGTKYLRNDEVLLYDGPADACCPDPTGGGIAIKLGDKRLLGSPGGVVTPLGETKWPIDHSPRITILGNEIWADDHTMIYKGEVNQYEFESHPNGVVIRLDNRFILVVYKP